MTDNVHVIAFSPDGRLLATANAGGFRRASKDGNDGNRDCDKVCLVDVATSKVIRRLAGHRGGVSALAFSPDGRLLASGGSDTTILIWDVTAVREAIRPPAPRLQAAELDACWEDLAGADGLKAHRAVWALAASPGQCEPFLKQRLRAVAWPDAARLARLLADLDAERFAVRQAASRELEQLGERAEPALRRALAQAESLELRRRLEGLVQKLDGPVRLPETRRALRAIEVLEHLGTPEARKLLVEIAGWWGEARPGREARASLDRLTARGRAAAAPGR